MRDKLIYLSGAISGIDESQAYTWRRYFVDTFEELNLDWLHVFNPVEHFSEASIMIGQITNKEIMDVELHKLRNSDYVFYNCNHSTSLGSMAEIAIAYEYKIPILSFNEQNEVIHPWLDCMITKQFRTKEALLDFFVRHLLYDD